MSTLCENLQHCCQYFPKGLMSPFRSCSTGPSWVTSSCAKIPVENKFMLRRKKQTRKDRKMIVTQISCEGACHMRNSNVSIDGQQSKTGKVDTGPRRRGMGRRNGPEERSGGTVRPREMDEREQNSTRARMQINLALRSLCRLTLTANSSQSKINTRAQAEELEKNGNDGQR